MLGFVCKNRKLVIGSNLPFFGGFVNIFFKNQQGQGAQGLWENSAGVRLRTLTVKVRDYLITYICSSGQVSTARNCGKCFPKAPAPAAPAGVLQNE